MASQVCRLKAEHDSLLRDAGGYQRFILRHRLPRLQRSQAEASILEQDHPLVEALLLVFFLRFSPLPARHMTAGRNPLGRGLLAW
jgi:hypothetical protein